MKIIFYGSSHGYPEPGRKCSCSMIEIGDARYFIDMGTNAVEGMINRGLPLDSVKGIFITHMHSDHTGGLIPFLDVCSWKFKTVNPKIYLPGDTEKIRSTMANWVALCGVPLRPFEFFEIKEGVIFDDGILRITAYKTKHTAASYAFLAEAEGKRVLFSGDLSHKGPADDFPMAVFESELDLAICEVAHFEATEYLPLFSGQKNLKRLCFNHYSERLMYSLYEAKNKLAPLPVIRANDGMEIVL
ncbi:MAG: ribonuclease Z [Clostridia bacterium]|nr:ribonuclease Z [Clostridia bacterium]